MGRAGKPWAAAAVGLRAEKEEKKVIHFFLNFSSKQVQNEISTQFEIQLQTKQFKIVCSGMYAHSWLSTYI